MTADLAIINKYNILLILYYFNNTGGILYLLIIINNINRQNHETTPLHLNKL